MSITRTLIRASTLTRTAPALKRLPVLSRAIHSSPYRSSAGDPYPLPLSREVEQQRAQPQGGVESAESSALNTTTEEEWPMPQPLNRTGEKVDTLRARLVYQARKRGMLEGDLLLSTFARDNLATMSHEELLEFDKVSLIIDLLVNSSHADDQMLDEPDWDIYYWSIEKRHPPERWAGTKLLEQYVSLFVSILCTS